MPKNISLVAIVCVALELKNVTGKIFFLEDSVSPLLNLAPSSS